MARPNRSSQNYVAAFKWCQLKWTISVMFFVFHILVFAYFARFEINCFSLGTISEGKNYGGKYEEISNLRDAAHVNGSIHRTNQINTDLKSHIFDKLLSEEMLSGMQYDDQEYNSHVPLLQVITKNNFATPTLEMKQKWPSFENIISNGDEKTKARTANRQEQMTSTSVTIVESNGLEEAKIAKMSKAKLEIQKSVLGNVMNNKVVGMRSLTSSPLKVELNDRVSHGSKMCTCMKSSPSPSTCSHSCTGSSSATNKKRCTHSTPARFHDCSRPGVMNHSCTHFPPPISIPLPPNPPPFMYPAFYMPNTYFSTPSYDDDKYYPPTSYKYNEIKYSRRHKKKHRKTTRRLDDELYYDDIISNEQLKMDKFRYIDEDDRNYKMKHKKIRDPTPAVDEYYEEPHSAKFVEKVPTPSIYNVNQDDLIKEIVKDLNNQHNKVVIKDCYCDSSLIIQPNYVLVNLFILLYKFAI